MLIDTHCHLDYLKQNIVDVLNQCQQVGVQKLISISVDGQNMKQVGELIATPASLWNNWHSSP